MPPNSTKSGTAPQPAQYDTSPYGYITDPFSSLGQETTAVPSHAFMHNLVDEVVPRGPGGLRVSPLVIPGNDWQKQLAQEDRVAGARMSAIQFQSELFKHDTVSDAQINHLFAGKTPQDIELQRRVFNEISKGGDLDEIFAKPGRVQSPELLHTRLKGMPPHEETAQRLYDWMQAPQRDLRKLADILANITAQDFEKIRQAYREHKAKEETLKRHHASRLMDTGKKLFEMFTEETTNWKDALSTAYGEITVNGLDGLESAKAAINNKLEPKKSFLSKAHELLNGIEAKDMPIVAEYFKRELETRKRELTEKDADTAQEIARNSAAKNDPVVCLQKMLENRLKNDGIEGAEKRARDLVSGFDANRLAGLAHDAMKGTAYSSTPTKDLDDAKWWAVAAPAAVAALGPMRNFIFGTGLSGRVGGAFSGVRDVFRIRNLLGLGVLGLGAGAIAASSAGCDEVQLGQALAGLSPEQAKKVQDAYTPISAGSSAEVRRHWGKQFERIWNDAPAASEFVPVKAANDLKALLIDNPSPNIDEVRSIIDGNRTSAEYSDLQEDFKAANSGKTLRDVLKEKFPAETQEFEERLKGYDPKQLAEFARVSMASWARKLDLTLHQYSGAEIDQISATLLERANKASVEEKRTWTMMAEEVQEARLRLNGSSSKSDKQRAASGVSGNFKLDAALDKTLNYFGARELQLHALFLGLNRSQLEEVNGLLIPAAKAETLAEAIGWEVDPAPSQEFFAYLQGTPPPPVDMSLGGDLFQDLGEDGREAVRSVLRNGPHVTSRAIDLMEAGTEDGGTWQATSADLSSTENGKLAHAYEQMTGENYNANEALARSNMVSNAGSAAASVEGIRQYGTRQAKRLEEDVAALEADNPHTKLEYPMLHRQGYPLLRNQRELERAEVKEREGQLILETLRKVEDPAKLLQVRNSFEGPGDATLLDTLRKDEVPFKYRLDIACELYPETASLADNLHGALEGANLMETFRILNSLDSAQLLELKRVYPGLFERTVFDAVKEKFDRDGRTILDGLSDEGVSYQDRRRIAEILYPDAFPAVDEVLEAFEQAALNGECDYTALTSIPWPKREEVEKVFRGLFGEVSQFFPARS